MKTNVRTGGGAYPLEYNALTLIGKLYLKGGITK